MFRFIPAPAIKKILIASTLALNTFSINAYATLESYTVNGADLVYSSVSNVTWTKDGNLLGSLFASSTDSDGNGNLDIIDAIIAVSPTISHTPSSFYPTGIHTITRNDFGYRSGFNDFGTASWWGAMAYINYLNNISYGGSNQWRLPTLVDTGLAGCNLAFKDTDCGYNVATNDATQGNELAELYGELGSKYIFDKNGNSQQGYGLVDNNNLFINEQASTQSFSNYWYGTEYSTDYGSAWRFNTSVGFQSTNGKQARYSVWAITDGRILTSAVPEPEFGAMLFLGLSLVGYASRHRQIKRT